MSFNSHKRKLLDETESLAHRASHARSCALHVANKLGLGREAIIERVAQESGVSLHNPGSVAQLLSAFWTLESIKETGRLPDTAPALAGVLPRPFKEKPGEAMKKSLVALMLIEFSLPCLAADCMDSDEYRESVAIAEAAFAESSVQLGQIRDFLMKTQGLDADQSLGEMLRFSPPEAEVYDNEIDDIGEKIKSLDPWTLEKCAELIKLQRRYEAVTKAYYQFMVDSIIGRQAPEPVVADSPGRP
jgi:hypothetical protein